MPQTDKMLQASGKIPIARGQEAWLDVVMSGERVMVLPRQRGWLFRLRPPGHAALLLGLALVVHYCWPSARWVIWQCHPCAWVLGLGGGGVAIWGIWEFRRHGTHLVPGKPVLEFVCDGPFRFSRNPMYLGLVAAHLSFALGYGTLPFFLSAAATFVVLRWLYIPFEEELLREQYGEIYTAYCRRVRRWI